MTRLLSCLSLALVLALTGCETTGGGDAAAPVNTACPMMADHSVDADVTMDFEGHTIGFCCSGCVDEFEALSREEKIAKLQLVGVDL